MLFVHALRTSKLYSTSQRPVDSTSKEPVLPVDLLQSDGKVCEKTIWESLTEPDKIPFNIEELKTLNINAAVEKHAIKNI